MISTIHVSANDVRVDKSKLIISLAIECPVLVAYTSKIEVAQKLVMIVLLMIVVAYHCSCCKDCCCRSEDGTDRHGFIIG